MASTWIFGTGPRQTKPLDGMFNKGSNVEDQGLLNWSAIRGSNTDFNNNSRATQGGCGFASDDFAPGQCFALGAATPANPAIYDHGITQGASDALDAQTLVDLRRRAGAESAATRQCGVWRGRSSRPIAPPATGEPSGRRARSSTATTPPPSRRTGRLWIPASPGSRRRRRSAAAPANEFFSFTCNNLTIKYLENIGTFDVTNPLEIRDNAAASTAFGVNGFNVPSLLSINYHAPYLHRGQAQTLEEVFPLHGLGPDGEEFPPTTTIQTQLTAAQRADLLAFLKSIDGTTNHFRSEGDAFRDSVRLQGACPMPPPQPMASATPVMYD